MEPVGKFAEPVPYERDADVDTLCILVDRLSVVTVDVDRESEPLAEADTLWDHCHDVDCDVDPAVECCDCDREPLVRATVDLDVDRTDVDVSHTEIEWYEMETTRTLEVEFEYDADAKLQSQTGSPLSHHMDSDAEYDRRPDVDWDVDVDWEVVNTCVGKLQSFTNNPMEHVGCRMDVLIDAQPGVAVPPTVVCWHDVDVDCDPADVLHDCDEPNTSQNDPADSDWDVNVDNEQDTDPATVDFDVEHVVDSDPPAVELEHDAVMPGMAARPADTRDVWDVDNVGTVTVVLMA